MAQPNLSVPARRRIRVAYEVEEAPDRWLLDEDDVPETPDHDLTLRLLCALLEAWVARERRPARVARNLACRWDPDDARVGVDPDVAVIEPDCATIAELGQLRLWEPGHLPPRVAFEVVSQSTAAKDYRDVAARYGRLGVQEVWVFDPELHGPPSELGPWVLSGWRRAGDGDDTTMERVYAGDGPGWSDELGAWLHPTSEGRLRIAADRGGAEPWLTAEEVALAAVEEQRRAVEEQRRAAEEQRRAAEEQRQAAEEQRRAADEQRRRADAAEAEVARLRRLLERAGGDPEAR